MSRAARLDAGREDAVSEYSRNSDEAGRSVYVYNSFIKGIDSYLRTTHQYYRNEFYSSDSLSSSKDTRGISTERAKFHGALEALFMSRYEILE